jgi:hypothetical protein
MISQRLPKVLSNPVSLTGLIIVVFNIGFIIFLSIVEAMSSRAHPYADLVIWLILPAFVLCGVVLIRRNVPGLLPNHASWSSTSTTRSTARRQWWC